MPTEWEWQWAAQGGAEARKYPWGEWRPGYANTNEAGLGRAIAVGLYPHGISICGALDMAGNVFEGCQNDKDDHTIVNRYGNSKLKMLRGGSFVNARPSAACAYRHSSAPRGGGSSFGVRLVDVPLARL